MIGIDHQQRDRCLVARRAPPFRIDLVIEFAPVLQAGERVGRRQLLQLVLGLRAAADLAREEQRGADHEQDQRHHDRADPDHFPVPKLQDRRQRLSDHDKEQIRAAASNVKPRRRIHRPDAGIGRAFLQILGAPACSFRQILSDDVEIERRPHDDRAVAAQHGDGIAGVEGQPAEQVMEIAEADRADDDAEKAAIGVGDAPAEHDRIGAAMQHRAAHVQAHIGIGRDGPGSIPRRRDFPARGSRLAASMVSLPCASNTWITPKCLAVAA